MTDHTRIRQLSGQLYEASKGLRVLTNISWEASVRQQFFADGARELPKVSYPAFDASPILEATNDVQSKLQKSDVDQWLGRQATALAAGAHMMAAVGTPEFYRWSAEVYGTPMKASPDQKATPHDLAVQLDRVIMTTRNVDLGEPADACYLADHVASELERAAREVFGDEAPVVSVVDDLSANALAGPDRIRVRRSACFTDKDVHQLIEHEAFVHVATSLNGRAQEDLRILGAGHPGTTRTQEGLAVFAELITGTIDVDRMRRLSERVLAIQLAVEGADFLDVYAFFKERTGNEVQAYENARRVFRGGVLTGGAPFTKDVVYLDGLLRVSNFLRALVSAGRADCLRLLFVGKLDLEDIPVLAQLSADGLCRPAKYLPPWAKDLRFLVGYLGFSAFLDGIDLKQTRAHYDALLAESPQT